MCNLYSETKGQAAIRALFRTGYDTTGNLPAFPGIFPDQMAPIVRNSVDGKRELVMARWGMPGPPQFGGQPVTNIRNVASPHWRGRRGIAASCREELLRMCHDYAQNGDEVRPVGGRQAAVRRADT
jgi:putative SOS response-associated peptidase YedK